MVANTGKPRLSQKAINRAYATLSKGKTLNLTGLLREELKEYRDTPKGETQVIKLTLEFSKGRDPIFTLNQYRDKELIDSQFYYLDEKAKLKKKLDQLTRIYR